MPPYEGCKVEGPHKGTGFYFRMAIRWPDGSKTNTTYHRYLLEIHLGRYLTENEVVHHVDNDCTNNSISNLRIMDRRSHAKLHGGNLTSEDFNCPNCKINFTIAGPRLLEHRSNNRLSKIDGPFCSKSCANKYHNAPDEQEFICPWCKIAFKLKGWKLSNFKAKTKAEPSRTGPYCSRRCSGFSRVKR